MGIDRKSLRPYIKRLIEKKLIWRSSGKQGKYFPTEEAYKDTRINAHLIAQECRSNILNQDKAIVLNNSEQIYPSYINFATYTKYFQPKFTENDLLEALLFELSNRIGGYIIYILIQAMNPNNHGKIIASRERSIEKDSLIEEWIQKAISSVIPFLGRNFKDSVYKALGKFPTSYDKHIKYMSKRPFLKYDIETANELDNSFAKLYPLLYHVLNRIMTELPQRSAAFAEFEQYMRKRWKEQEVCKHEYGNPTYTLYGYGKQCNKCGYIQTLKRPHTS